MSTFTRTANGKIIFVDEQSISHGLDGNLNVLPHPSSDDLIVLSPDAFPAGKPGGAIIFDWNNVTLPAGASDRNDLIDTLSSSFFFKASGGGGGAVSSVFTRTGAVVAAIDDYTKEQITGLKTSDSPEFDNLTLDDWVLDDVSLRGTGIGHPRLMKEFASGTNPTIIPFGVNTESGLGRGAINAPSMIADGVEIQRWSGTFTDVYKPLKLNDVKSGATQVAAGAGVGELWSTASHATLPDNVILIGV